ncbi:hypothetical protein L3Y34_006668 [Caenorhabditis briggsae]|uniref:F-box domain-containing protein n=1 Tax=Caenorhabditis briggsae TaxID=6238 RepID=A0AAE9CZU4_CAEBR|nr:hypothetical protein L3Y34_006668 [Caenorhabditis briggsae]
MDLLPNQVLLKIFENFDFKNILILRKFPTGNVKNCGDYPMEKCRRIVLETSGNFSSFGPFGTFLKAQNLLQIFISRRFELFEKYLHQVFKISGVRCLF